MSVATLVRRAREDVGLSQRELAALVGLHQPNLAAIESGTRRPNDEMLARILRVARLRPSIPLELHAARVRQVADRFALSNLRVFGSAALGTDHEASDVDLLVEAADDVDFLTLGAFRNEVAQLLGFPVDVVIDEGNSPAVQAIRAQAVPL